MSKEPNRQGDVIEHAANFAIAVQAVCDFFPAEWGGVNGITIGEATALVTVVMKALCQDAAPSAH